MHHFDSLSATLLPGGAMALLHPTRTDEAYLYIRNKLITGELSFGSRLHISKLAEETGFSNTPIRESLAKLEMYGLAESFPHKGVYVVSPSERDVQEMVEGRLCLEVFMAKSVIENVTSEDIPKMREACQRAVSVDPAVELYFEEGLHGYYARVSANRFLDHLYQRVMALLNVLYIQALRSCDDDVWIQEHRQSHFEEELQIVDAIDADDLEALEEKVSLHIQNLGDFLLTTLKKWPPAGLNWHEDSV